MTKKKVGCGEPDTSLNPPPSVQSHRELMENYSGADGRFGHLKPLPHWKVILWQAPVLRRTRSRPPLCPWDLEVLQQGRLWGATSLVSGPRASDSKVPAAVEVASGTASAHSDAEATMESVAPVIEEGSEGQSDRQGRHLLLQHSTYTPVTIHQACQGKNTDQIVK